MSRQSDGLRYATVEIAGLLVAMFLVWIWGDAWWAVPWIAFGILAGSFIVYPVLHRWMERRRLCVILPCLLLLLAGGCAYNQLGIRQAPTAPKCVTESCPDCVKTCQFDWERCLKLRSEKSGFGEYRIWLPENRAALAWICNSCYNELEDCYRTCGD